MNREWHTFGSGCESAIVQLGTGVMRDHQTFANSRCSSRRGPFLATLFDHASTFFTPNRPQQVSPSRDIITFLHAPPGGYLSCKIVPQLMVVVLWTLTAATRLPSPKLQAKTVVLDLPGRWAELCCKSSIPCCKSSSKESLQNL